MRYDIEYDSYKFSAEDMRYIIGALYFYHQHSPNLDYNSRDDVLFLVKSSYLIHRICGLGDSQRKYGDI